MQEIHAVPCRKMPTMVTVDSRSVGRRTPRFVNLVVRVYREWDESRDEPVRYRAVR